MSMPLAQKLATLVVAAGVAPVWVAGCGSPTALSGVNVEPSAITPDGDGDADVARISYTIGVPSLVTITLTSEDGTVHAFRDARPRSPGTYDALFGGVIDDQMLSDGTYALEVVAGPRVPGGFEPESERFDLHLSGGDTVPPVLAGFSVQPSQFTPNQDGLGDRVAISYRLDEPADVRLWLETADGRYVTDILEEKESGDFPGEPGPHVYDFDAGVDADAPPPPDGDYVIVGRARDAAGNVATSRLPLMIKNGGQPRVALMGDVDWSSKVVPLGNTLTFTATVVNMGDTPIRTRGPVPGHVYDNTDTFNSLAPLESILLARHGDLATSRHVSLADGDVMDAELELGPAAVPELEGSVTAGRMEPATEAATAITICGTVLIDDTPVRAAEVLLFESDGDNGKLTATDSYGRFCFQEVPVPPPRERTFSRSSGAVRLGLEYDERRTDLGYPYRWQLGQTEDLSVCEEGDTIYLCLAPGQTVTVTGGVRFVEPPFGRQTNVWVALMHEDVRRIQGPYGQQSITVEY